jgi:glucose/arabinose dehydrogenase
VFVSTRTLDRVYAITNKDGKRESGILVKGLVWPNGIALHDGALFIAERNRISMIGDVEHHLDGDAKPVVIYSDLPNDEPHGWKFLAVGPDNRLYFNIGAPCNICMPPPTHAQLRSINLDGSDPQVVARGIRQVVGMDFDPTSKVLYFTENQRDWLSEDQPNDKLNRLLHPGKDNFGYPYCHGGDIEDPQFGWGHSCDEFTKPVAQLGPHSAPLGMRFYTGHMFPVYRAHVPGEVPQRDLHRPPRLVEQDPQARRRRRSGASQPRRHGQVDRAVHHRLPGRRQQVSRPTGRYGVAEGRLDAVVG